MENKAQNSINDSILDAVAFLRDNAKLIIYASIILFAAFFVFFINSYDKHKATYTFKVRELPIIVKENIDGTYHNNSIRAKACENAGNMGWWKTQIEKHNIFQSLSIEGKDEVTAINDIARKITISGTEIENSDKFSIEINGIASDTATISETVRQIMLQAEKEIEEELNKDLLSYKQNVEKTIEAISSKYVNYTDDLSVLFAYQREATVLSNTIEIKEPYIIQYGNPLIQIKKYSIIKSLVLSLALSVILSLMIAAIINWIKVLKNHQ